MNREKLAWLVSVGLIAILALQIPGSLATRDDDYSFVRTLVDIHRQVATNYVEPVDEQTLRQGAIDGMLRPMGRTGGRGRRIGSGWALAAFAAIALPAGSALAEKKKPGLFDFQKWSTPVGQEKEAAGQLLPGRFDLTPMTGLPGEPRPLRVRVYADRDYRLLLRWQTRLRAQLKRVNAVVEPVFAVRFEIESVREWDRSHSGAALDPILDELHTLDPGSEVDLVIGLVTPMRGVATSVHHVGLARILSRHFVMRGMDDEQEILALEREFKLLNVDERQNVYDARKSHKEVVVFLHEWGHTLGLLHHGELEIIMNPACDPRQTRFSPFEQRLIAAVLQNRLQHPKDPFPEAAALESLLLDAPPEEGSDRERAELLEAVRSRARFGVASAARGAPPAGAGLTAAEAAAYNRAVAASNAGHDEQAWTEVAPVFARLRTAKSPIDAGLYRQAAAFAVNLGALTDAESLLVRLERTDPEASKLATEIETQRHRLALPPAAADQQASALPPAREVAYVAAFRSIARALDHDDAGAAREQLSTLAAAFPDAAGVDLITCELDARARNPRKRAQAGKRCEAALAKYPGATRALALLALMAADARQDALAEKHLRRAIQLDPADPGPWRMLADLYRSTRARQRLTELDRQHQALFSKPLP